MTVKIQVTDVINRPVADVFHFHAHEHVRNHPRWDTNMQLEQVSDGPIGVGTIINRLNTRSGTPVEGSMEVVEFEVNRAFGLLIQDGPVEMRGLATYAGESHDQTNLTLQIELPGMDESMDTRLLTSQIRQSLLNIKQLIETEV